MKRAIFLVSVLSAIAAGGMGNATREFPYERCALHTGIRSPVLAVEFASNAKQIEDALCDAKANRGLIRSVWIDTLVFVPCYVTLFVLLGRLVTVSFRPLFIVLCITAGALDWIENYWMMKALRDPSARTDEIAAWISCPATIKFALLFGVMLFLAAALFTKEQRQPFGITSNRLLIIAFSSAAAIGLLGLVTTWPVLVETGMAIAALAIAPLGLLLPWSGKTEEKPV